MSNKVTPDESVAAALAAFKNNDESNENAYYIFGYDGKLTLKHIATGDGCLNEAKEAGHFPPKEERYCLLRIKFQVEMARTVKFAFITWFPDSIPPMRKAMLSTHKPQVSDILRPWHITLDATEESELDQDEIMDKIGASSGIKVHVTEKASYTAPSNISSGGARKEVTKQPTVGGGISMRSGGADLAWKDQEAAEAAFVAIKSDTDPTDWLLFTYDTPKILQLEASGEGGLSELEAKLDDAQIYYAYFRVTEQFDKSKTVKFGTLKLMTNKVPAIMRAKVSTHQGFLQTYLSPSQVSFDLIDRADFSEDIVMEKLGAYTGTKSRVTKQARTLEVIHG